MLATESDRPNTIDAGHVQPKACAATAPTTVAIAALRDRAWNRNPPDGKQFVEVELEPDAEHQQDDADLGELFGDMCVGDESGRIGPDDEAGQQVADDGRQADALCDVAEQQRRAEAARESKDDGRFLHALMVFR